MAWEEGEEGPLSGKGLETFNVKRIHCFWENFINVFSLLVEKSTTCRVIEVEKI